MNLAGEYLLWDSVGPGGREHASQADSDGGIDRFLGLVEASGYLLIGVTAEIGEDDGAALDVR